MLKKSLLLHLLFELCFCQGTLAMQEGTFVPMSHIEIDGAMDLAQKQRKQLEIWN